MHMLHRDLEFIPIQKTSFFAHDAMCYVTVYCRMPGSVWKMWNKNGQLQVQMQARMDRRSMQRSALDIHVLSSLNDNYRLLTIAF